MGEVFGAKLHCKMSDFFASFPWFCVFLLKNLIQVKSNYGVLNHVFFDPHSGTVFSHFTQRSFNAFCHQPTMVADIFTEPYITKEKASYGSVIARTIFNMNLL